MPQKHEIYQIFYIFSKVFAENFIKKYSTGNEEWIEFETATITSDYVSCRQNQCTYPAKTNSTSIFL